MQYASGAPSRALVPIEDINWSRCIVLVTSEIIGSTLDLKWNMAWVQDNVISAAQQAAFAEVYKTWGLRHEISFADYLYLESKEFCSPVVEATLCSVNLTLSFQESYYDKIILARDQPNPRLLLGFLLFSGVACVAVYVYFAWKRGEGHKKRE